MNIKKDFTIASHFLTEAYGSDCLRKQLLGHFFDSCGWIYENSVAAGIREFSGHDGKPNFAVYVAKHGLYRGPRTERETWKIIPDNKQNKLFPSKVKAVEYIESLMLRANKDMSLFKSKTGDKNGKKKVKG